MEKKYIFEAPSPSPPVCHITPPAAGHTLTHTRTHTKHTVTPRTKIGSQQRFGAMNWLYSGGFSPSSPFSLYLFLSFSLSNHLWAATLHSSYNCLVRSLSLAITAGYESSQSNTDTTAIYICVSVCVWVIRQEGRSVYIWEARVYFWEIKKERQRMLGNGLHLYSIFSESSQSMKFLSPKSAHWGSFESILCSNFSLHICLRDIFYKPTSSLFLILCNCLSLFSPSVIHTRLTNLLYFPL